MSDKELVRFEKRGAIGIITVDNPPVNALSPGVPEGILAAVEKGNADPDIKAMILTGAGRSFIAGADIREFGKGRPRPARKTQDVLEDSEKPIVAAIHGFALGGGLEYALGCHYRVALKGTKVGLPEIALGLLPGGGGTQRLPRLVGPKIALDLITSGRHVPAEEAKELGILDEVFDNDLVGSAVKFAESVADRRPFRRIRELTDKLEADMKAEPDLFEAKRKQIARRARNQKAPYNNIAAVEASTKLPFAEGLKRERELFEELENSDESRALRYAFFAEREAMRVPDIGKDVPVKKVGTVAVVGAGTMGGGIAMSCADFGVPVRLLEVSQEAVDKGMDRIRKNYAVSVQRGSLAQAEMDRRLALIRPVTSYEDIADADAVIEAVFEQMDVKKEVFAKLDATMKDGALLLTNTSALDVDEIASATKRPEAVAGAHFFSPANVMKMLEVVRGAKSAKETVASTMALGKAIGKVPVACGNCDGFVANRSRAPFSAEMVILLEEGALPEQVDKVMVDFGYPMGPFAVGDLAGLDIGYAGRQRRAAADPNYRKLPIADKLVELGRYGQKTSAGWYRYEKGDRTPHPDPEVAKIIKETAAGLGIEQKSFTDEEILRRMLFASVNEACRIIEEGIAYRASDIDIMWLYGFGFPRYRGGLMFWADQIGSREVYNQIAAWHQQYGDRWKPSALLRQLAESGTPFREAKPPAR